jgi:hypothetical protein
VFIQFFLAQSKVINKINPSLIGRDISAVGKFILNMSIPRLNIIIANSRFPIIIPTISNKYKKKEVFAFQKN